ncbi:NAD(P)/FAD-dependent oxidoreductase [Clostridium aminobutyricum]|uniref:NAD(FAD)-utilizing dehydrogenase n=1 Tax=Clostridium aminobutyricum TaxID=33953 RepID=A0A939IHY8_CLOAM|nr:NAD(FAD)-utilizing dehydrogenase [Clostridium aminobutyricum]MBN7771959.1 NAD(FAD)-utilizing dehydrogenase [Clostridium aminobutyricum]
MYRISQIKLDVGEKTSALPQKILKKIGSSAGQITEYRIVKESIDARDKGDIKLVYTVDFEVSGDGSALKLESAPKTEYQYVESGNRTLNHRPVIVGFGPCGMFAALILSEMGYKPLVIERGNPVEKRVQDVERFWKEGLLNEESNVQFGEGGAGTFSDGKLTTQIKDSRIRKVLEELVAAGGGEEILYKQKPHIGTDVLRTVVLHIRKKILERGGEIRFASKLTNIKLIDGAVAGVEINGQEWIETENLVLAIGHSARDTFRVLNELGFEMVQKPFSIGVRIEHPQEQINKAQYGKAFEKLGAADYKLSHRCGNGRGVYTFCMCPGGEVIIASSQDGRVVTNGMSYHDRDGKYANSALLVDVRTEDFGSSHPLAGVEFQEKYEKKAFEEGGRNYKAPKALWRDFVQESEEGKHVRNSLPEFAVEALLEAMPYLGRKLKGFDAENAILTAVETRSSSPVRIIRDEQMQSKYKGIYPAGEGAGYAGGITSAAVDGIRIAEQIVSRYKPFDE